MTRTEEQFTAIQEKIDNQGREQKDNLYEGISTIHVMIKIFEETTLFSLGKQNKRIETLDGRVDDHERAGSRLSK